MKRKILAPITVALTIALAGCATTDFTADRSRMFKSGAIGCVAGGALGAIFGDRSDALKGCVAGGAIGAYASYQAQLNEAQEVQRLAHQAGMKAAIETAPAPNEEGERALKRLVIDYDPTDMSPMDARTKATIDRLAELATKSQGNLSLTFQGQDNCQVPIQHLQAKGVFNHASYNDQCGQGQSRIIVDVATAPSSASASYIDLSEKVMLPPSHPNFLDHVVATAR